MSDLFGMLTESQSVLRALSGRMPVETPCVAFVVDEDTDLGLIFIEVQGERIGNTLCAIMPLTIARQILVGKISEHLDRWLAVDPPAGMMPVIVESTSAAVFVMQRREPRSESPS